jgi:hypothetical protein
MTIAALLMAASAAIVLLLGSLHLLYTFHGPKLLPRDAALQARMKEVSPVITSETTMWKCWVGFNASHSLGPMLFGVLYGYFALTNGTLLFGNEFLLVVGGVFLAAFVVLAKVYWFRIPFGGVVLSLLLYLAAVIAHHA